jgi:Tfp pilus assembly protein PilV
MLKIIAHNNQNGLSLVEVAAAMIVLAIGILGIAPMMIVAMDANSFSRDLSQADNLAQDRMEAVRLIGSFSPLPFITTESNVENRFTRRTQIDAYESDATVPARVYRVEVTISWADQNGLPRSATYSTFLAKN